MNSSIEIYQASKLGEAHWTAWRQFHLANPELDSPYFHPQFVRGLIEAGYEVVVAVTESATGIDALFPFERNGAQGRPAGWPMNDFQGVIAMPGTRFDLLAFMRTAGLKAFLFDHLVQTQAAFTPHIETVRSSPFMEIQGGLDAYKGRLADTGKRALTDTLRRVRKAERELGPLRLELQSADSALLQTAIEWKQRQYRETGADNFLGQPRPRAFMEWLFRQRENPEFCGALTALWAGDKLIALHIGMRARRVLHWWFPSYDPAFENYSPGRLMLAKLVEAAEPLGLDRIDLGKGDSFYKQQVMTGSTVVCEGYIETRPALRALRRHQRALVAAVRASPTFLKLRELKHRMLAPPPKKLKPEKPE